MIITLLKKLSVEVKKEKSGAVESVGMSTMETIHPKNAPIVFFRARHLN